MTKYKICNEMDKELIKNSITYLQYLLLGRNEKSQELRNKFANLWSTKVTQINFYPQGTVTKYLNNHTPGVCRFEGESIIIDMLGTQYSNESQLDWIKHEVIHELCHSYANTLPSIFSNNPNGIEKDGILYKNSAGMISEVDAQTGEEVGTYHYGKLLNETTMDIISTMGLVAFDENFKNSNQTVDTVLEENYSQWGNVSTGYSLLTSITRLTIAAFSNNGITKYEDVLKAKGSIATAQTRMHNGEIYRMNDFLYGIMCDPLHIEKEFDKFMGDGSYRIFAKFLDKIYQKYLDEKIISPDDIKKIMNVLPDFLNKKTNYYLNKGILNQHGVAVIISNFNSIWNSMEEEYSTYFDINEINKIENRSKQDAATYENGTRRR